MHSALTLNDLAAILLRAERLLAQLDPEVPTATMVR